MATQAEANDILTKDVQDEDSASASIDRTAATANEQGQIHDAIKKQQAVANPGAASSFVADPQFWHDVGRNYLDLNVASAHGLMHAGARLADLVIPGDHGFTQDIDASPSLQPSDPTSVPSKVGDTLGGMSLFAAAAPESAALKGAPLVKSAVQLGINMAQQSAFWAAVGFATGDDRVKDAGFGALGGAGGEAAATALRAGGAALGHFFSTKGTELPIHIPEADAPPAPTTPWTPDSVANAGTAHPEAAGTQTPPKSEQVGYTTHKIQSSDLSQDLHLKDNGSLPDNAISYVAKDADGKQISHVTVVPRGDSVQGLRMDTAPEHQGKGIASDLLKTAMEDAHANGKSFSSDTQLSTGAAKVYAKQPGMEPNINSDAAHDATDGAVNVSSDGRPLFTAKAPPKPEPGADGAPVEPPKAEPVPAKVAGAKPSVPPTFNPYKYTQDTIAKQTPEARQALVDAIAKGDMAKVSVLQRAMPNLPFADMPNGGNLQATFHALADHYKGAVQEAGGAKVIPKAMQLQYAANQGRDPQAVMDALSNLGQHTDDGGLSARMIAGNHLDIATADRMHAAAVALSDAESGSVEHIAAARAFDEAHEMKLAVQATVAGAKNELGRAMGALRYMQANRAVQIPDGFGDGKTSKEIADAFLKRIRTPGGGINLQAVNETARAMKAIGPSDWLMEMMRHGMLSSPALHWVNAKANVLRMGVSLIEPYLAGAVGTVSKAVGTVVHAAADAAGAEMQPMQEQMTMRMAGAHTLGAWNAVTDASVWKDAIGKIVKDAPVDYSGRPSRLAIKGNISVADLPHAVQGITNVQQLVEKANTALDAAGTVIRTPGRALGVVDHLNVTVAQRASLTQQAYMRASSMADATTLAGEDRAKFISSKMKELVINPTDGMLVKAQADGSYASMQEQPQWRPTLFGAGGDMDKPGFGAGVSKLLNQSKLLKMLVAPFTSRPGNAFRQGIMDYSPLGAMFDKTTQSKFLAGGVDMNMAAARMLMGTSGLWAAWHLADSGHLTGSSLPGDLSRLNEIPDYSLKVGDEHIPIKRMEPEGLWLGGMADAYNAIKSRSTTYDTDGTASSPATRALMAFAMATGHLFLEMPAMSGLKRIIGVADTSKGANLEQKGTKLAGAFASEAVPFSGLGSWINSQTDGLRHSPDSMWDVICQHIPGMEGSIPKSRDIFGRSEKTINQYATTTGTADPLSKAVSKVQGNIKPIQNWLVPPTDGQQGVPLDEHLSQELEQIKGEKKLPGLGGQTFPEYATKFIQSSKWQNAGQHGARMAPDGGNYEHMDMLKALLDKGNGEAWRQLYVNHPDLRQRQREAAQQQLAAVRPQ